MVINEVLAVGVSVLTTNCCGAGLEILKENKGGRIVMPNNPDVLAKTMLEMLDSEVLVRLRQEACFVAPKYTIENMVKYTADIIEKVYG